MKGFDALNAMQKTSALCNVPIMKNQEKLQKKLEEKSAILAVFLFFLVSVLCKELSFFALHSVHHNPSFELSKSTIQHFFVFFTKRGDPCDLGRPKNLRHP